MGKDVKDDEIEETDEESTDKTEVEELREKLADAETKAGEYVQLAQRLQADFDNYRKRTLREKEEYKLFAAADLIKDMLSIIDDFDRALAATKEENDLVIGIRGIRTNMMKTLEAKGLKEIPTDGKFDPAYHEAFSVVEAEEEGMIAEVFQKGYTLGDKVLRFAKVKVTKKAEEKKEEVPEQEVEKATDEEAPAEAQEDTTQTTQGD